MRLKRAKQYRKLMNQYEIQFGFRNPYQVLLESQILEDAHRQKIDLVKRLEGVLHGPCKLMITQCDIRHLYNAKPKNDELIMMAKRFERRRCGRHELDEPLSSLECLKSVIDPKDNLTNKHRYVVASDDPKVRAAMRNIAGVPLIFIKNSVMIMEPMNGISEEMREKEEKSKFRLGLKGQRNPGPPKRKREDDEGGAEDDEGPPTEESRPQKKNKRKGPKEPNPLSMRKKKDAPAGGNTAKPKPAGSKPPRPVAVETADTTADGEGGGHRKRKRKPKSKGEGDAAANADCEAAEA